MLSFGRWRLLERATDLEQPRPPRRRSLTLVLAAAACVLVVSCGDTSSQAAWVAGHPDTALLSFKSNAPGVCAITVQYPNDAPAAIQYLGSVYVQVDRESKPSGGVGHQLDRSGDWVILQLGNGDLLVVTLTTAYRYRVESNC
jgi:hypothetical protein